jgi:hypothetical protein
LSSKGTRADQTIDRTTDVLVVGAGSAGCSAAIAAALSTDGDVLLVERYGFLGGISTQSLDTFYGFFTPGDEPKKAAGGVPDMVVDRLDARGEMFLRPNTYGAGTGVTYNPEYLKVVWDQLLEEAGARVLLHTQVVDVEAPAGAAGAAEAPRQDAPPVVVLRTVGGLLRVAAKRIIDTSGDAAVARLLGARLENAGELEAAQTFTTTFRMCNVDLDAFKRAGGKNMLQEKMARAVDTGTYPLPRKKGSVHPMVQPNCIATVAVRVPFDSPFDPDALTRAEMEGRKQVFVYEDFLRNEVPGFENAKVIGMSAPQIGIRESRRLYGAYRLTREDCLSPARFDDAVMLCGAPIEDHRQNSAGEDETEWVYIPDGGVYQVPYRCFVPEAESGSWPYLWVAGRCFSATHSAQASCRSMAQTMSMGQAVGVAAALSLRDGVAALEVPGAALQEALKKLGAVINPPSAVAETGRDDWHKNRF